MAQLRSPVAGFTAGRAACVLLSPSAWPEGCLTRWLCGHVHSRCPRGLYLILLVVTAPCTGGLSRPRTDFIVVKVFLRHHALDTMLSMELCSAEMCSCNARCHWYSSGSPLKRCRLNEYRSGYCASLPAHINSSWWKAMTPSSPKNLTCMYFCMACWAVAVVMNV